MTWFTSTQRRIFAGLVLIFAFCVPAAGQEQRRDSYTPPAREAIHAVAAERGMVVAQEKIAARIGADVLKRGGNAVDAAVATGFAMAVSYPRAGNIGGGGFMVIHSVERHEDVAIDYLMTASSIRVGFCAPRKPAAGEPAEAGRQRSGKNVHYEQHYRTIPRD
jgi:gamma-glutamyltranspeptidase/glutathione hydrolase